MTTNSELVTGNTLGTFSYLLCYGVCVEIFLFLKSELRLYPYDLFSPLNVVPFPRYHILNVTVSRLVVFLLVHLLSRTLYLETFPFQFLLL